MSAAVQERDDATRGSLRRSQLELGSLAPTGGTEERGRAGIYEQAERDLDRTEAGLDLAARTMKRLATPARRR